MTFDKSKVCVAGLHDVPIGTNGYYSNELNNLEIYVLTDRKTMLGKCAGFNCNISKYNVIASDMSWMFFYPLPEKKYRPYKTIEEALTLKGKWLKHKSWDCFFEVTKIEMLNGSAIINNIESSFLYEMYTMEDGTPIGIPE